MSPPETTVRCPEDAIAGAFAPLAVLPVFLRLRGAPRSERLGTPKPPAIRFTRGTYFGASRFTHLLRPAGLLAPLHGSDRYARPPGAFTSRLPTVRLPSRCWI